MLDKEQTDKVDQLLREIDYNVMYLSSAKKKKGVICGYLIPSVKDNKISYLSKVHTAVSKPAAQEILCIIKGHEFDKETVSDGKYIFMPNAEIPFGIAVSRCEK